MAETIRFLVERGVPVMAHVGLTPQSINTLGGYKVVGRAGEAERVFKDAVAVEAAGAFAVVLEKVPVGLSARITQALTIPTIGIGAGVDCDGQVLVTADLVGAFPWFRPPFAQAWGDVAGVIQAAIQGFSENVRESAQGVVSG
jgi:3-methyl-2-oxobutanoate hydroxymethyltransferase